MKSLFDFLEFLQNYCLKLPLSSMQSLGKSTTTNYILYFIFKVGEVWS